MAKQILILFLSLVTSLLASAQYNPNLLRQQKLVLTADTLALDSLSIVPGSEVLTVAGNPLDTSDYHLDYARSALFIKNKSLYGQEAQLAFRCLPVDLDYRYKNKDIAILYDQNRAVSNPFRYKAAPSQNELFGWSSLDKSGSISRGVNFGNNQNLGVNSNLNLQLAGKITDEISVLAAITDENIPIQPEGNTQQLQDFDQVYIQVFNDNSKLTAGDFTLNPPNSHFMRYLKRAQGGSFETEQRLKNESQLRVQGSAAISRGKFARNVVQGIEGNQGPYRLRGAENELFIIILSGTERVFIDGKQLERGQENDYVINYNTAEISFTAKQLITKDKRIVVEFQYTDQNYARSLFQLESNLKRRKGELNFNFYSEQDAKNQPLQQDLSDEQRQVLIDAGDNLNQAIINSIDSSGFDDSQVRYALIDTTTALGTFDSVLVYTTNPESAIYSARFSDVGPGNGTYVLSTSTANGRVYQWVGFDTVTGAPLGRYEPVVLLISPKQQQMLTLGGKQDWGNGMRGDFEVALTNNDRNTFSNKDQADDYGYAAKAKLEKTWEIGSDSSLWELTTAGGFEKWDNHFNQIERIRQVEFYRNWNLRGETLDFDQDLVHWQAGAKRNNTYGLTYQGKYFQVGPQYRGINNGLDWNINTDGWKGSGFWNLLSSDGTLGESRFDRRKSLLKRYVGIGYLGYRDDYENNRRISPNTDTLNTNSYRFYEWEVFLESADSSKNGYRLFYIRRTDDGARSNEFQGGTLGESYGLDFRLTENSNSRLQGKVAYRTLKIINEEFAPNQEPENTLVGRLEYNLRAWKGAITSGSFYEIGSGLEARQEFVYLEVAAGQGIYTWIDYNDNGVKELDEFEVAEFQDQANYVKVFTPTNEYVRTYTIQFNQNLMLNPGRVWINKTGIKKFISRFSDQVAFRVDRKTNQEQGAERFNPFLSNIEDSVLISQNASFRNTFYFNRTNPVFGADFNYQQLRGKSLLINGFQSRQDEFYTLGIRWNVSRSWIFTSTGTEGQKGISSDVFTNRNYLIDYYELEPKITYQPGTKFRISAFLNYAEKQNQAELGNELGIVRKIGLDAQYNKVGKGSLLATVNYVLISFGGNPSSALGFEMLEGLQTGENGTWSLSYQRTFENNLQLNLNYNGRQSENVRTIHAGGIQVRAFF